MVNSLNVDEALEAAFTKIKDTTETHPGRWEVTGV
jgi:hypothetical protein